MNSGLSGEVIATDGPFGNLVTNISGEDFLKLGYGQGQNVHITIGKTEMDIPFVRTFSDVPLKKPLLYIDSRGHLGLAVNQGSFESTYGDQAAGADFHLAKRQVTTGKSAKTIAWRNRILREGSDISICISLGAVFSRLWFSSSGINHLQE